MAPADVPQAEIRTGKVNEHTLKRGTGTVIDLTSGGQLRLKGNHTLNVCSVGQAICMTVLVEAGRSHMTSTGQRVNQAKVEHSARLRFDISEVTPEPREAGNRTTWTQHRHIGHVKAGCLHYPAN